MKLEQQMALSKAGIEKKSIPEQKKEYLAKQKIKQERQQKQHRPPPSKELQEQQEKLWQQLQGMNSNPSSSD